METYQRVGAFCFFLLLFAPKAAFPQSPPLFESDDPIAFTIRAPLDDIFDHRKQDSEEYPGVVLLPDPSGQAVTVDVDIRTRGRARLEKRICRFPPLRLDFPKDSVHGTLFEGQNRLKLVTHCQDDREEYEQYVLLESLIYRTFNILTDLSFRVRLARITYEDTTGERDPVTRYGFLIEHEDEVAERNGWEYLEVPVLPPSAVDPENLALNEVFQYFIGNTDWSPFKPDPGSPECCHNSKPIGTVRGPVFTLPYDFDLSGLLNTRYANRLYQGNLEYLDLPNVRMRRFRGLCTSAPQWPGAFERFNAKRSEIEALFVGQADLEPDVLEETLEYIEDFYEVINDEGKVRSRFERHCRREG